jgi:hypothetical protein
MGSTRYPWTFGAVRTGLCLAAALLVTAPLTARSARAEWAIDAYAGAPFPDTEDVGAGNSSEFDGNFAGGARIGYFIPMVRHFDVGAFLDVSGVFQDIPNFQQTGQLPGGAPVTVDAGDIDFNFVPITALVLMRVPFGYTREFISGRYQFYGGAGPSLIWSEVNGGFIDDQALDLGADVRAGFNFLIFRNWGIFTEYRFTYFEPDFNDTTLVVGTPSTRVDFKADVDSRTHYVMFGSGIRF